MSEKEVIYKIREDERFGCGQYGCVYLARKEGEKEGEKKLYVIKIPIEKNMNDEKRLIFNNEVDILNKLTPIQGNIYTSIIYDSKEFTNAKKEEPKKEEDKKEEPKKEEVKKEEVKIEEDKKEVDKKEESKKEKPKKDKKEENKIEKHSVVLQKINDKNEIIETIKSPFYVMDYFSKGLLYDYYISKILLSHPKLIKFIFRRIIISYKNLHSYGICHLDIKLDNIIFDKDFWPIIIDFGFSQKLEKNKGIKVDYGSIRYATPEAWRNKEVTGEKADIFSLGHVLFNLVTGKYAFDSSKIRDEKYILIIEKNYKEYWKKIAIPNLPDDFKNLFIKMVAFKAKERPSFDDILNDPYLAEVSNLSKNEEDELIKELNIMHDKLKNPEEIKIEERTVKEGLTTRGFGNSGKEHFTNHNLKPRIISKDRLNLNKFIKINGNFSEVNFMNNLVNKINKNKKFKDFCQIVAFENKLRFEVSFEYGEDENDKLEVKEKKEEDENEGKEQEKEEETFGNCRMEIELFEYEKGKYLLEFLRTGGRAPSYNHHFSKIKEIIEELYN